MIKLNVSDKKFVNNDLERDISKCFGSIKNINYNKINNNQKGVVKSYDSMVVNANRLVSDYKHHKFMAHWADEETLDRYLSGSIILDGLVHQHLGENVNRHFLHFQLIHIKNDVFFNAYQMLVGLLMNCLDYKKATAKE